MLYQFDDLSFGILSVERFWHKNGFFEVKARPYAAFAFRLEGVGAFEIAGKRFVSRAGDVIFLPAQTPYRVDYSGSCIIVAHLANCNYTEAENFSLGNAAAIELRFERLLEAWHMRRAVNRAKSLVYDLLEAIADDQRMAAAGGAFADCVAYIDAHVFDPELDVESVCACGFLSASSLQRGFLTHFGMSPKQYLIKRRMERAVALLAEGDCSVKEVAFAVGYRDEKYFSRAFKRKYACSPSQFRAHIVT